MRRTLLALATAFALASCATTSTSQPVAPTGAYQPSLVPYSESASRVAAEQPAGVYVLDTAHASVSWRLRHAGIGIFVARFDKFNATLDFDPANPAASSINATIEAASVNTGVLNNNGERAFDREIATQAFGSAQHPQITFVSRSINVTSPTTGEITGDLTLRGVTKPVTLQASFEGGRFIQFRGKQVIAFSARGTFNRKDFGATLSNPLADGFAGDIVDVEFHAEFIKQ